MALIKHAESGSIARDAVVLDLGDLQRQGEALREKSEREARGIIEEAEREAKRLIEESNARGFEEGKAAGEEAGKKAGFEAGRNDAFDAHSKELRAITTAWSGALDEFIAARDGLLRDARRDVLELAVRLGERVVRREIENDRESAARQLGAALELVTAATRLRIEINGKDRDAVTQALPGLLGKFVATAHAEVVENAEIGGGGCRVRTDAGVIDAGISEQIERLAGELLNAGSSERWADGDEE